MSKFFSRFLFVFWVFLGIYFFIPISSVQAAAGNVEVTVLNEQRSPVVNATVEVTCNASTYAVLGTTNDAGSVSGNPTTGTTCVSGSTLAFRVSSSTFATQSLPVIGTSLLPYIATVDPTDAETATHGSTNTFHFGVQTTGSFTVNFWNAATTDPLTEAFPTRPSDASTTTRAIAYNWGNTISPYAGIDAIDWFVEATKTVTLGTGWYEFQVTSDDGARVYLDGATIIDDYILRALPSSATRKKVYITGGSHTIKVEYFEHEGVAALYFGFHPIDTPTAPLLEITSPVYSPVNNKTQPEFLVHTDIASILVIGGACSSEAPFSIAVGTSTINTAILPDGTYTTCTATATDPDTDLSTEVAIPSFTVAPPVTRHLSSCAQLQALNATSSYYADNYVLDEDLDCTGIDFVPLAWSRPFIGDFDGGGYAITNLSINRDGDSQVGLFASMEDATVTDLSISGDGVVGRFFVGALAGRATNVTMTNVHSTIDILGDFSQYVGGLVGYAVFSDGASSTWSDVSVDATVQGTRGVGGIGGIVAVYGGSNFLLSGTSVSGTVQRSITGSSDFGGIFGSLTVDGSNTTGSRLMIDDVITSTDVDGGSGGSVGGFIGTMGVYGSGPAHVFVTNSVASGTVRGGTRVGGFIGIDIVSDDGYATEQIFSQSTSTGNVIATGSGVGGFIGIVRNTVTSPVESLITFDSDHATGNVQGSSNVGGFLGGDIGSGKSADLQHARATGGLRIFNSTASGNVTGNVASDDARGAGGFIGTLSCRSLNPVQFSGCLLRQNSASGNVSGYQRVGGFIGEWIGDSSVEDAYSTGNVTAAHGAGGFVGDLNASLTYSAINRVYASSTITTSGGSPSDVGGLIGSAQSTHANTSIGYAFASASMIDSSEAVTHAGFLIGSLTGIAPYALAYHTGATPATACIGTSSASDDCNEQADVAALFTATTVPLNEWDFSTVWESHASAFPTLRGGAVTVNVSAIVLSEMSEESSGNSAIIEWRTDRDASSRVSYGTNIPYALVTTLSDTARRVKSHRLTLTDLTGCTLYRFVIFSADGYGNAATSTERTFRTLNCGGGAIAASGSILSQNILGGYGSWGSSGATSTVSSVATSTSPYVPITSTTILTSNAPDDVRISGSNVCHDEALMSDLKLGSDSIDVVRLQRFLNAHGSRIAATGFGSVGREVSTFGRATKNALASFQKKQGLLSDGVFAGETKVLIQSLIPVKACSVAETFRKNLALNGSDDEVKTLQIFLNSRGFIVARSGNGAKGKETNVFGKATKTALIGFQKAHGIKPTGIVDQETRSMLNVLMD